MTRLTLLTAAVLLAPTAFADDDLAAVDKAAPTFRLPVYNAKEFGEPSVGLDRFVGADATDKKAKVLIVSFMASFCGPCKKEMPYLQALFEKNKDKGLRIMMVAIDKDEEGQKKVADLITLNKVTFPVLKDRYNIVARRWLGTQSPLPSLFMVKPDGVVGVVHRGYSDDISATLLKEVASSLGVSVADAAVVVAQPEPAAPEHAPPPAVEPPPAAVTPTAPKKGPPASVKKGTSPAARK